MAFDVNSLGGKLIDNQELLKLIQQGCGGGADFFVVNVTKTGSGDSATYSADKTITQIVDAYNEGKSIYAIYPLSNTNKKVIPLVRMTTGTSPKAFFCDVESSAGSGTSAVVVAPIANAITIDKSNVTLYRNFDLLTKEMEVRTIDSESTNYRYPTAKAVYDFVSGSSQVLFVKLIDNDDTNELSSTTSVADIYNALNDGKLVYLRVYKYYPEDDEYETNGTTCFVTSINRQGDTYIIYFTENSTTNAQYSCGIVNGADVWVKPLT